MFAFGIYQSCVQLAILAHYDVHQNSVEQGRSSVTFTQNYKRYLDDGYDQDIYNACHAAY